MTHKDAPPQTELQVRFEQAYSAINKARHVTVGLSRDAQGRYHAQAANDAWNLYQSGYEAAEIDHVQHAGNSGQETRH
jgi:hypothetical protein